MLRLHDLQRADGRERRPLRPASPVRPVKRRSMPADHLSWSTLPAAATTMDGGL